jgi:Protein of unknown function (DUF998)
MTTPTTKPPLDVRITKSLLGYGVIAGPIYALVVTGQALGRAGFDPTRHPASVLANGSLGWIQTANFLVTGAMTIAAAVGVYRATRPGRSSAWAGWLVGGYGTGLIGAAAFRADPVPGFPPGTPDDVTISWHGVAHFVSGTVGFACLIAACFVLGHWFTRRGQRGWAWYSRVTAILFAVGFGAISAGAGAPLTVVMFTVSVVLGWAWLAAVSLHLYRAEPACAAG